MDNQNKMDEPNGTPSNSIHFRKNLSRNLSALDRYSETPSPTRPVSSVSFNRFISNAPSISQSMSIYSASVHSEKLPPASTPKEKSKMSRRYFATVLAICYAIFLVIFGAVVFIGDAVIDNTENPPLILYPLAQAFCIYMIIVAFSYFLFLYIDIRMHVNRAKRAIKDRELRRQILEDHISKLNMSFDGPIEMHDPTVTNSIYQRALQECNLPALTKVSHRYCFARGRHGEFLYLKLGAAWFAFGLLIHSILQISYQIFFLSQANANLGNCASITTLVLDIMFPIYSMFVLFFIFKYMNVIINEYRGVSRIFLMHAIGTSLAFWVFTIVRETADAIALSDDKETNSMTKRTTRSVHSTFDDECGDYSTLNTIHRQFSPYLYPFIIEYCILIVGIWYMMWANISHCPRKMAAANDHKHGSDTSTIMGSGNDDAETVTTNGGYECMDSASGIDRPHSTMFSDNCADHENDFKTSSMVYADCQATFRGLFAGLLLIVITIVFIILLFVGVSNETYLDTSILINDIFEFIVLVVMIIAVVLAYVQTIKLDVNHHPISKLDDVLLFVAIPAFFLETIFSLIPAIANGSWLNILIFVAQIIQVLIQTPFIIDGLRRCSNAPELRKKKPGRELCIFLTIANVSLWVFYTFSVKTEDVGDERYAYYGYTLWNILNHISLPLIMFYRFHSSVCLVDIWRHSYEPEPMEH